MMQIPGGNHTHGRAVNTRRFCAANMIFPQDACGVWTPIPRKLNEDSVKIAPATRNEIFAHTGGIAFGSTSESRIFGVLIPIAFVA